jgi:hypothetical protein
MSRRIYACLSRCLLLHVGQAIAFEIGSTGDGRNLIFNGRRQPSCGGTSRMTRECQVRIWCSEASYHSSG